MCSRSLAFVQVELGAAADDLAPEGDVVLQHPLQAEGPRLTVHQRQHVHRERRLHRRVAVELVQDLLRLTGPAQLDDDAHAVAVRLVAQVADAVDPLVAGQVGDALDQGGLVGLVGQLGDDDLLPAAAAALLDVSAGAHDDPAAAIAVGFLDGVLVLASMPSFVMPLIAGR